MLVLKKIDDWIQVHRKLSVEEGHSSLFAEQMIPWGFYILCCDFVFCFLSFCFFLFLRDAWKAFRIQLLWGLQ